MRLFGLTGGLASGKSQVASQFRERGLPVLDANQLAREVLLPGEPGFDDVVAAFGDRILSPRGGIDRPALAAIVFSDPEQRSLLNRLVHPRIGALTAERTAALAEQGHRLACYEAALLVENGLADLFRPLVVVGVPPDVQLRRALARDGEPEEVVRGRLAAQLPLADKVAAADVVIDNSGSLADLAARADDALARVCAIAQVDPTRYGLGCAPR